VTKPWGIFCEEEEDKRRYCVEGLVRVILEFWISLFKLGFFFVFPRVLES
jgi:hypothetical protein